MGVACPEETGSSISRNLSLWWSEETEQVFRRFERWAGFTRGYNRLRSARLSPGRLSMETPSERARLACCALDYKSNGNLESRCLEAYSLDHSIYFKTIGEIRRQAETRPTSNTRTRKPSTRLDCGDFLASDFDEDEDDDDDGGQNEDGDKDVDVDVDVDADENENENGERPSGGWAYGNVAHHEDVLNNNSAVGAVGPGPEER